MCKAKSRSYSKPLLTIEGFDRDGQRHSHHVQRMGNRLLPCFSGFPLYLAPMAGEKWRWRTLGLPGTKQVYKERLTSRRSLKLGQSQQKIPFAKNRTG